jgi:hypothetical protein
MARKYFVLGSYRFYFGCLLPILQSVWTFSKQRLILKYRLKTLQKVATWPLICINSIIVKAQHITYFPTHIIRKLVLVMVLTLSLFSAGMAQGRPVDAIDNAMKAGNAAAISRYFGPSIDITINNSTSTYSRTQGEQVLRDFFARNAVRDFDIDYSGPSSSSNTSFTIGTLQTANGKYKVYLFLRPADGGYVLKELRIEK